MPHIKRILFPVDFSPQSAGAARYVEMLAGRFQAKILLLHVVSNGERILADELLPIRQRELDAFLTNELRYFDTEKVCLMGDAADKIVETAKAWGPDLVMMPTHGLGMYRRFLLGSVTAKVLHDLDCPVWTDIHAEVAPRLEDIHCRRILCGVDLMEGSRTVLDWAAFVAEECSAELGIVHAVPAVDPDPLIRHLDEEFIATLMGEAKEKLDALQKEAGTSAICIVEPGDPANTVTCAARRFGADLTIIGRHARGGLIGHLRRNAYAIVRESSCPVVSV